jgi:hypothetical protein
MDDSDADLISPGAQLAGGLAGGWFIRQGERAAAVFVLVIDEDDGSFGGDQRGAGMQAGGYADDLAQGTGVHAVSLIRV